MDNPVNDTMQLLGTAQSLWDKLAGSRGGRVGMGRGRGPGGSRTGSPELFVLYYICLLNSLQVIIHVLPDSVISNFVFLMCLFLKAKDYQKQSCFLKFADLNIIIMLLSSSRYMTYSNNVAILVTKRIMICDISSIKPTRISL